MVASTVIALLASAAAFEAPRRARVSRPLHAECIEEFDVQRQIKSSTQRSTSGSTSANTRVLFRGALKLSRTSCAVTSAATANQASFWRYSNVRTAFFKELFGVCLFGVLGLALLPIHIANDCPAMAGALGSTCSSQTTQAATKR